MIRPRRMRWEWYVARIGAKRIVYRILAGNPKEKTQPERPRRKWMILKSMLLD
jgi:hypothetical protein